MNDIHPRKEGMLRLNADHISKSSPHYIVHRFLKDDIQSATAFARGRLLDIGCGNKPYQHLFKNLTAYIGCDVVQSSDHLVDVICPANELGFQNEEFDTVFSTQVIEHVGDFQGMAREAFRVLKKGGHAIFTAPFCWELHEEPYDFFRFTRYGLKETFEKAGFEIVYLKSNGGKWAAIFQLWLNVLLSTRKYITLRSRIIAFVLIKLRFIYLYNLFAVWLDKKFYDDILTLNYLIVLKKREDHEMPEW